MGKRVVRYKDKVGELPCSDQNEAKLTCAAIRNLTDELLWDLYAGNYEENWQKDLL